MPVVTVCAYTRMCVYPHTQAHTIALSNSAVDCFSASLMALCSVEGLESLVEAGLWLC